MRTAAIKQTAALRAAVPRTSVRVINTMDRVADAGEPRNGTLHSTSSALTTTRRMTHPHVIPENSANAPRRRSSEREMPQPAIVARTSANPSIRYRTTMLSISKSEGIRLASAHPAASRMAGQNEELLSLYVPAGYRREGGYEAERVLVRSLV